MIFRSGRFRKPLAIIAVFSCVAVCRGEPDAEAILRAARLNPAGQKISLRAQLRTGSTNMPFEIVVDEAIRYRFENPDQELILELREDSSSLFERVGGKTASVKPARYDDPVRGTGITYEDLFLRFLYWKRPRLLGEDTIRSRKAWKIELQAWGTSSQVRSCASLDRSRERCSSPDRGLQPRGKASSSLRSHLCPKDRWSMDAQADARGNA